MGAPGEGKTILPTTIWVGTLSHIRFWLRKKTG